jgi:hypothetical protein
MEAEHRPLSQGLVPLPRYMNTNDICRYLGISSYLWRQFCKQHHIELTPQGVNKLVEVAPVLHLFVQKRGAEHLLGDRWPVVKAAVEAMQREQAA